MIARFEGTGPIIKGNYPLILLKGRYLGHPATPVGSKSHYHHQRFTLSFYLL